MRVNLGNHKLPEKNLVCAIVQGAFFDNDVYFFEKDFKDFKKYYELAFEPCESEKIYELAKKIVVMPSEKNFYLRDKTPEKDIKKIIALNKKGKTISEIAKVMYPTVSKQTGYYRIKKILERNK